VDAVHVASTYIEGRAGPAVNLEPVTTRSRRHDVRDRVDRANFVEVDSLHRNIVDLRLCIAQ